MSNLDDMHENGIHDYLKFIKFGYGRGTDHSCKDIRAGLMSRDEAIEMVERYDHVKPRKDLERWLEYVGMSEDEFDAIADTFRDPRVWAKDEHGDWVKDSIRDFDARRGAAAWRAPARGRHPAGRADGGAGARYAADVAWLLERRDALRGRAPARPARRPSRRRDGASTGSTIGAAPAASRCT